MTYEIYQGDCLDVMRFVLDDNSVDAIVTDPPYELGFMGKSWDNSGIANNPAMWAEVLRVLKPGGHLLAFSGSRTYHRMVCAIEDAGFEVRDQMMWIYGSGFPKSLDVSKAIDSAAGAVRDITRAGQTKAPEDAGKFDSASSTTRERRDRPATDVAQQWQGWGTALKPAHEPICVARKPLTGTVAANVLKWGTGALNIDGCRVADGSETNNQKPEYQANFGNAVFGKGMGGGAWENTQGRWPANLIHDGSDEVLAAFPQETESAARFFYCAKASKRDRNEGLEDFTPTTTSDGRDIPADNAYQRGKTERQNHHPTVKPTDLMRYLCRLITPPGGVILDLFTGSGSTGKAALLEGFRFIGCEMTAEYLPIIHARLAHALKTKT